MNPALLQAIAAAASRKGDVIDRRSLPLFREGVGPTMFRWAPASLDAFVGNIPQPMQRRPPVIFPPNSPLGRLQRAYGVR